MAYQVYGNRTELSFSHTIDYPRTDAMDEACRGLLAAFEADSAMNPDYGHSAFEGSITYSTTTTTTDTVPPTV
jgi:hypothetical protein